MLGLFKKKATGNEFKELKGIQIGESEGVKIAEGETASMYALIDQIEEYRYLKLVLAGSDKLKTFDGADMMLTGESSLSLESDTQEIKSDFSYEKNVGLTEIDFELENDLEDKLKILNPKGIVLKIKSKELKLSIISDNWESLFISTPNSSEE